MKLSRSLLVVFVALSSGIGCAWILANDKPVCPPDNLNCGCTDEKHGEGCPTTPTDPRDPGLFDPMPSPIGQTSGDAGTDTKKSD